MEQSVIILLVLTSYDQFLTATAVYKTMMPEISVIIPCYNVENYIDRCLESVIKQTIGLDRLEIICVNDASTDGTLSHLKNWEQKYRDNIMLIPLESNQMLGEARNIGLSHASGEYVAFIDSDDWLDTRYFELMLAAAGAYDVPMVRCGHVRDYTLPEQTAVSTAVTSSEIPCRCCQIDSDEARRNSIRIMSQELTAWGKLIRRSFLLENNIYFPKGLAYEDNLWGPLLYIHLTDYCVVDLPLYHYFVNDGSISLKVNASHHPDFLTVQLLKWNELDKRGFMDKYYDEIAYDFLHSCFLDFMKIICLRYDPPSYSLFMLMCRIVEDHVPDYAANPYFEQGFTDFQKILLGLLAVDVDKKAFGEFAEYVKKLGI